MKKLFNIIRNICFVLVLCYLAYHATRIFQPNLIEEYLVLHHDVQETPLGIANLESFSLQSEVSNTKPPKKLTLENRKHQVYFHPNDLIRADIYEGMVTLHLVNDQQLKIKVSLDNIWELLEQHNLSKGFWKSPSYIFNLSHIIAKKTQNVSEVPREDDISRKNDYRLMITFSDQEELMLRYSYKKELETALMDYLSNLD